MGSLKSSHGRTEMPYLGKGLWGPFQALLPNLTKVSEPYPPAGVLSDAPAPPIRSSWYPPPHPQASSRRSVFPPLVKRAAS